VRKLLHHVFEPSHTTAQLHYLGDRMELRYRYCLIDLDEGSDEGVVFSYVINALNKMH
jgi:hypothetical protein